jgi:uncharacterized protein YhbP (UPF0306 family)
MNQEILDYIKSQRAGVFAIEMLNGSPHAATIHFAHVENPLIFLFETHKEYRKAEPLMGKELCRASFVIGSDEKSVKTLQMDGEARIMTSEERKNLFEKIYLTKFPEKKSKAQDSKVIAFLFIPK